MQLAYYLGDFGKSCIVTMQETGIYHVPSHEHETLY